MYDSLVMRIISLTFSSYRFEVSPSTVEVHEVTLSLDEEGNYHSSDRFLLVPVQYVDIFTQTVVPSRGQSYTDPDVWVKHRRGTISRR